MIVTKPRAKTAAPSDARYQDRIAELERIIHDQHELIDIQHTALTMGVEMSKALQLQVQHLQESLEAMGNSYTAASINSVQKEHDTAKLHKFDMDALRAHGDKLEYECKRWIKAKEDVDAELLRIYGERDMARQHVNELNNDLDCMRAERIGAENAKLFYRKHFWYVGCALILAPLWYWWAGNGFPPF